MNNYILSIEDGGFEAQARVTYDPHSVRPLSLPNHLCIPLEQAPGNISDWEASPNHAPVAAVGVEPRRRQLSGRGKIANLKAMFALRRIALNPA